MTPIVSPVPMPGMVPRAPTPAHSSRGTSAPGCCKDHPFFDLVSPAQREARTMAPSGSAKRKSPVSESLPPLKNVVSTNVVATSPSMRASTSCARIARGVPSSSTTDDRRPQSSPTAVFGRPDALHGVARPAVQSLKAFSGTTLSPLAATVAVSPVRTRSCLPGALTTTSPLAQ
jgi:hypothetical protein